LSTIFIRLVYLDMSNRYSRMNPKWKLVSVPKFLVNKAESFHGEGKEFPNLSQLVSSAFREKLEQLEKSEAL